MMFNRFSLNRPRSIFTAKRFSTHRILIKITKRSKENKEIFPGIINVMDIIWYAIGSAAAFLTMFGFVPQIIKIVKTKYVRDISLVMLIQTSFGTSLLIFYGIHIGDLIVTIANCISLTILVVVIALFLTYRSNRGTDKHLG